PRHPGTPHQDIARTAGILGSDGCARARKRTGLGAAPRGDERVEAFGSSADMIFVDTNVFMYAVGREHALREPARAFIEEAARGRLGPLCTSVEVLQELLHAYLPVGRVETLDAAIA